MIALNGGLAARWRRRMTRRLVSGVLAAVLGAVLSARAQIVPAPKPVAKFREGRVLIQPKPGQSAAAAALHVKGGRKLLRRQDAPSGLQVVGLRAGEDVLAVVREYEASGTVVFAEPDYLFHASVSPNDKHYVDGTQWGLHNTGQRGGVSDADIDAPEAWDLQANAAGVVVAVIDSGIRTTHEDLAPNLWRNTREIADNNLDDDGNGFVDDVFGINAISGTGNVADDHGHGTHVAGIIGAVENNGKGIAGVAWKVKLMALKFLAADGDGTSSDAVQCVDYARRNGAQVINASWGGAELSLALQTAIQAARNAGIVFVAAAGNELANNDVVSTYPANYPLDNIVSVLSTTRTDGFASTYSNYGASSVDIGAPGSSIHSCSYLGDQLYVTMDGTSMAAPFVTGTVALLRARYPAETGAQLIQRLLAGVDRLPGLASRCVSGGRVNARKALGPLLVPLFTPSATVGRAPLTVRFTNQSLGSIEGQSWDFGDGSAVSDEASPAHVFATDGAYNVILTVRGPEASVATKSQWISVVPAYNKAAADYRWIEPAAMPRLFLGDNGVSGALALPFTFYFYGEPQTALYVGANGLLGFSEAGLEVTDNANPPNAGAPNAIIMPYWDNLNPGAGGAIYAGAIGAVPNRRYVVSWVAVPRNSTPTPMTFQAILHETTGRIEFQYQEVHPESIRGGGLRASIGLEHQSGLIADKWTFNGVPNLITNHQAVMFNVAGTGGLEVTPTETVLWNAPDPATIVTNEARLNLRNTSRMPLLWSAAVDQPWLDFPSTGGVLAAGAGTEVAVRAGRGAAALRPGLHAGLLSFRNLNSGQGDREILIEAVMGAPIGGIFDPPRLIDGNFQLTLPAPPGTYEIEVSTNLHDWSPLQTIPTNPDGLVLFNEPSAPQGHRFFRARLLP